MSRFLLTKSDFPPLLKEIPDPPERLNCIGQPLDYSARLIAIVGTRRATLASKKIAFEFGAVLAAKGCTIVSGLAWGIDTEAHKGALSVGGKTIAVLGSGLDNITPVSNELLAREIQKDGTLITEYDDDVCGAKYTFPARNRIIAGISEATIVIEAPEKSGALITADLALNYDRDVYAVPGTILQPTCKGSNKLIRDSLAKPVCGIEDILDDLNIARDTPQIKMLLLSEKEQLIYEHLKKESPLSIDKLSEQTHLPIHELNSSLTILQIKGVARTVAGYSFVTR